MTEKELLYLDDTLGHIKNSKKYVTNEIESVEDSAFEEALKNLEHTDCEVYKNLYKLLETEAKND